MDGSYLSTSDPRVLIGLAAEDAVTAIRVRFPDGTVETWSALPPNRYSVLRQGTGQRVAS